MENEKKINVEQENKDVGVSITDDYVTTRLERYSKAIRHLRGTSGGQIFPIRKSNETPSQFCNTIKAGYYKLGYDNPVIQQLNKPKHSNDRVYSKDGISPTLNTMQGGNRQPFIEANKIRRLTPTECERLQGFPDGWTKYGIDEQGNEINISDTQRYKCLGNAVSVPVIEAIVERINNNETRTIKKVIKEEVDYNGRKCND